MEDRQKIGFQAMEMIHGPFRHLSPEEAETWEAPPMTEGHKGRYLWTDAFSVLNFLTAYNSTNNLVYLILASRLIATVHDVLGYTRDGSSRLPNATEEWPLIGGLRIGKTEDEDDPDGDGQYHHYLTMWMFALYKMSIVSSKKYYNDQAISLAKAIHKAFIMEPDPQDEDNAMKRPMLRWKMSIDLRRPLVVSEGNLDPVDGYVIFRLLQNADGNDSMVLQKEIKQYKEILDSKWRHYESDDPLDLGMTLWTTHICKEEWSRFMSKEASHSLENLAKTGYFSAPMSNRLAFREFGACLGIAAHSQEMSDELQDLWKQIISCWTTAGILDKASDLVPADLKPISLAMLAAAVEPGAFLSELHKTNSS